MAGNGGKRAGAGRPPKVTEDWIKRKFGPDLDFVYGKLLESINNNDTQAMKLFLEYCIGKPVQRQELTGANGSALKIEWIEQKTYIQEDNDGVIT